MADVKCRFLLPNGQCELDKCGKCDGELGVFDYTDTLTVIKPEEICGASSLYGNRYVEITPAQIEELKAGKVLCYADDYGFFIKLKEGR